MQARGSRCWTNPFVCFRKTSDGFRIEPTHTDVDRPAVVVELWDTHFVVFRVYHDFFIAQHSNESEYYNTRALILFSQRVLIEFVMNTGYH
jgi:hypothetical protein